MIEREREKEREGERGRERVTKCLVQGHSGVPFTSENSIVAPPPLPATPPHLIPNM